LPGAAVTGALPVRSMLALASPAAAAAAGPAGADRLASLWCLRPDLDCEPRNPQECAIEGPAV
jgi:hypothetical protein